MNNSKRSDAVQLVVKKLLGDIAAGHYQAGEALPSEDRLAGELGVSRLTLREAVSILRAQGVLEAIQGKGTYLRPIEKWRDLATIIRVQQMNDDAGETPMQILEIRRMVEVGAASLAARNASDEDVERMLKCLDRFDLAHENEDIASAAAADIEFHNAILQACGNPFLFVVMKPLEDALLDIRLSTSSTPEVRERARKHHREVFEAIVDGDPDAAVRAMSAHMRQTAADLRKEVHKKR